MCAPTWGAPNTSFTGSHGEHRIRFVRVGKELRFRSADLAAWLEAESVPARAAEFERSRSRRGRPRNRDRAA